MGPTGCSETSMQNYHSTLLDIPEEHRSQFVLVFVSHFYDWLYFYSLSRHIIELCDRQGGFVFRTPERRNPDTNPL
jgi:hypothetical protein